MSEPTRPLPQHDEPDTGEFWRRTRDGQLSYQQCRKCAGIVFYPRSHCTHCLDGELEWKTASGRATLYTYSVVRQSYHPFFRTRVPYAVAWVDLEEGPRVLTNLVGVSDPAAELTIGQSLMVEWERHEELSIPLFRPV